MNLRDWRNIRPRQDVTLTSGSLGSAPDSESAASTVAVVSTSPTTTAFTPEPSTTFNPPSTTTVNSPDSTTPMDTSTEAPASPTTEQAPAPQPTTSPPPQATPIFSTFTPPVDFSTGTLPTTPRPDFSSGSISVPTLNLSGTITLPNANGNTSITLGTLSVDPAESAASPSDSGTTSSPQFLANKTAVAATLVVVGVLVLAAIGMMLYWLRKRVAEKRESDRWNEIHSVRDARGGIMGGAAAASGSRVDFVSPSAYGINRTASGRTRRDNYDTEFHQDELLGMTQVGKRAAFHEGEQDPAFDMVFAPPPRVYSDMGTAYGDGASAIGAVPAHSRTSSTKRKGVLKTTPSDNGHGIPKTTSPSVTFDGNTAPATSETLNSPGSGGSTSSPYPAVYSPTTAGSNPQTGGYLMRAYRDYQ